MDRHTVTVKHVSGSVNFVVLSLASMTCRFNFGLQSLRGEKDIKKSNRSM